MESMSSTPSDTQMQSQAAQLQSTNEAPTNRLLSAKPIVEMSDTELQEYISNLAASRMNAVTLLARLKAESELPQRRDLSEYE